MKKTQKDVILALVTELADVHEQMAGRFEAIFAAIEHPHGGHKLTFCPLCKKAGSRNARKARA